MQPFIRRILIASALLPLAACARTPPSVQEGDVIFQTSRSSQSLAIQLATGSRYSHMGIVLFQAGKPYVFEAAATVRYTPLQAWIHRGEGQHYVVKRLRSSAANLSPAAIKKLHAVAHTFEGRPYDLTFEWSDQRIYCSELVWKIYDRALGLQIGTLQHLRDFNFRAPAVQQKLRERYHDKIPLDEQVISPVAMYDSPLLTTVVQQ